VNKSSECQERKMRRRRKRRERERELGEGDKKADMELGWSNNRG
jgi:hypothetical protein